MIWQLVDPVMILLSIEEQVFKFDDPAAKFDQAQFAKEAIIGIGEIGFGIGLIAVGIFFVMKGHTRIKDAWKKYMGGDDV